MEHNQIIRWHNIYVITERIEVMLLLGNAQKTRVLGKNPSLTFRTC